MNLTKRERRALAELEQALLEEDPTFAGQFDSWTPVQPPARRWGDGRARGWFGGRRI